MKQLTRQEVEDVVERLIPKNQLCDLGTERCDLCRLQPIYITTVLEKMDKIKTNLLLGNDRRVGIMINLWSRCGKLTESLQEIINDSKWEKIRKYTDLYANIIPSEKKIPTEPSITKIEVLTSPEANALFTFLQEIL